MVAELRNEGPRDQFPVGMRVLAVDDDPTCLRLLETLLRRCQYHVTATIHAITALKLLRENTNKFDLVISDVHMPDMDGFKLLELVGLEMDLPVIMLSANGDTKLVMKGITHGACDYLLKPVRIEELKNIWQHVVRRKKSDSKEISSDNQNRPQNEINEGLVSMPVGHSDVKLNKRRKEQSENEIEEHDENEHDNDDPSSQKRPRVVWSVELHQKFVAAVNQLGIDKAVPKKILDLMNVENLTRENVASHLQKYRLYLKRISSVASQQANMVAAFSNPESPYMRLGSVGGFGNYHTLAGPAQFQRALGSFPPNGMLGRFNTSPGGMHGPYSSRMIQQLGHVQNASNPVNDWHKFQPLLLPGSHNGMLQGMSTSSRLDQLQHNKNITSIGELSATVDDPAIFSAPNGFLDTKLLGNSTNSLVGVQNNSYALHQHTRGSQSTQRLGNQSSVTIASLSSEVSSNLPDHGRCNDNWPSAVPSSVVQPDSLQLVGPLKQVNLHPTSVTSNMSSITPLIDSHPSAVPSSTSGSPLFQDSRANLQCQAAQVTSNLMENKPGPNQEWDDRRLDDSNRPNFIINSLHSSSAACSVNPLDSCLNPKNENFLDITDSRFPAEPTYVDPLSIQHDVEKSSKEATSKLNQGYISSQWKPQNSYSSNNFGSLDDLVGTMMKQEDNKLNLMDGDLGCDVYSIGAW